MSKILDGLIAIIQRVLLGYICMRLQLSRENYFAFGFSVHCGLNGPPYIFGRGALYDIQKEIDATGQN